MRIAPRLVVSPRRPLPSLSTRSCPPSSVPSLRWCAVLCVLCDLCVLCARTPRGGATRRRGGRPCAGHGWCLYGRLPTTPRRPGGIRRAWPAAPTSVASSNTANCPDPTDKTVKGVAIAFPALGLSYYRLPISEMRPATSTGQACGDPTRSRHPQRAWRDGRTIPGQSLRRRLDAEGPERRRDSTPGWIWAAMVTFGMARIGLSVRNVTEAHVRRRRRCARAEAAGAGGFRAEHGPARRDWDRKRGGRCRLDDDGDGGRRPTAGRSRRRSRGPRSECWAFAVA